MPWFSLNSSTYTFCRVWFQCDCSSVTEQRCLAGEFHWQWYRGTGHALRTWVIYLIWACEDYNKLTMVGEEDSAWKVVVNYICSCMWLKYIIACVHNVLNIKILCEYSHGPHKMRAMENYLCLTLYTTCILYDNMQTGFMCPLCHLCALLNLYTYMYTHWSTASIR